jgi:putative flippase GtrA
MNEVARQALRFGAVGMLNTGVGLCTIWLAMSVGISPILSNAIGFSVGLVVSFSLNRTWTFRRDNRRARPRTAIPEMGRFFVAFLAAWLLNIAALFMGMQVTGVSPYLLQIVGMLIYTISFFLLCRIWVFKR